MLRLVLIGAVLFALCIAAATGALWVVNHAILGNDLWTVIDLLHGVIFGVPLFALVFAFVARRLRRPRIMEGRRRVFEER